MPHPKQEKAPPLVESGGEGGNKGEIREKSGEPDEE
jgi:hypothetical protein